MKYLTVYETTVEEISALTASGTIGLFAKVNLIQCTD